MNMLDAAVALAAAGRAVFPVTPRKTPLVRWADSATTDPETLCRWWARWPEAGIGMATGPRSGVWVLDVDPRHGGDESLDALQRTHDDLPDTTTVWTGGGGEHRWFLWADGGPRNSAGVIGPGLDVRGDGGYVVVPPSMHESGRAYAWRLDVPPCAAPPWLLEAAVEKPNGADRAKPRADADIPEGRRDRTLFELGAAMRANGFDADAILEALRATNAARCLPTLPDADLRRIATSAARYERGAPAPVREVAPTDERGANRAPLERFSEVVLGGELLAELREAAGGVEPVCDEGAVHVYRPTTGLWEPVRSDALTVMAQHHDGRMVYAGVDSEGAVKYKPLSLGGRQCRESGQCAARQCAAEGFFADARPGVPVLGGFAVVEAGGWRVLAPDPGHRARNGLPWVADPRATCPGWDLFLAQTLAGLYGPDDTAARVALLQEWIGACLVGRVTSYQRCLVLTGGGGNGKSQVLDVAAALFPGAVSSLALQDLGQEYKIAMLPGVRLNVANEIPDADICGTEKFKALIDGGAVTARRIYSAPFSLRPVAGHLFACNALPGTQDHSEGFWRRFLLLPLHGAFHGSPAREVGLAARIVASEMPGVLRWALDGAVRLAERGDYAIPASSLEAVAEWRESADPVALYVRDMLEADTVGSSAQVLYEGYARWARDNGHKPVSSTRFGPRLSGLGHARERTRDGSRYPLRLRGSAQPPASMRWD